MASVLSTPAASCPVDAPQQPSRFPWEGDKPYPAIRWTDNLRLPTEAEEINALGSYMWDGPAWLTSEWPEPDGDPTPALPVPVTPVSQLKNAKPKTPHGTYFSVKLPKRCTKRMAELRALGCTTEEISRIIALPRQEWLKVAILFGMGYESDRIAELTGIAKPTVIRHVLTITNATVEMSGGGLRQMIRKLGIAKNVVSVEALILDQLRTGQLVAVDRRSA